MVGTLRASTETLDDVEDTKKRQPDIRTYDRPSSGTAHNAAELEDRAISARVYLEAFLIYMLPWL